VTEPLDPGKVYSRKGRIELVASIPSCPGGGARVDSNQQPIPADYPCSPHLHVPRALQRCEAAPLTAARAMPVFRFVGMSIQEAVRETTSVEVEINGLHMSMNRVSFPHPAGKIFGM